MPFGVGVVRHAALCADAGIVDQHVQTAEGGDQPTDGLADLCVSAMLARA